MADYQPLLTRAVANLPSTSTLAMRRAIYERARKAQLAQLGTLHPPLPESDFAREEEALDQAIALVEAKFGGADSTPTEPPFAATTPAAATQQAGAGSAPADAARTEASIPPLSNLTKVVPAGARAEKSKSWLLLALAAVLGAVLAVACAAIVMRQKPRYLAVAPPEAKQGLRPLGDFRSLRRRGFFSPTKDNSTAPAASAPPGNQLTAQSGSEPANQAPDASSPPLPETARAAMLIAYASWQKGGIENANGRLRRWLPRHLDIDRTSDQDIQEIVLTTNLTPGDGVCGDASDNATRPRPSVRPDR